MHYSGLKPAHLRLPLCIWVKAYVRSGWQDKISFLLRYETIWSRLTYTLQSIISQINVAFKCHAGQKCAHCAPESKTPSALVGSLVNAEG